MTKACAVRCVTLLAIGVSPASAQVTLRDGPACGSCSIRHEVVATLSGVRIAGEPRSIVRTGHGRYLVTFWPVSDEILEFDSAGQFTRVFAATGQGPGEVSSVGHMELATADTLRVYDRGRVQVFNTEGHLVRTELLAVAAVSNATVLGNGRSVVNTGAFTRDGRGSPLRLLQGADVLRSFGMEDPGVGPTTPFLMVRSLTSDTRERFWSAGLTKYEIHEWNSDGEHVRTWTRDVPWFRSWNVLSQVTPDAPPDPRLGDLEWLGDDRLLVLTRIASQDWRDHLGEAEPKPGGQPAYPNVDYQKIFSARLEVLDLRGGTVLVQSDGPGTAMLIIDQNHLAGYMEDAIGNPEITIWRIEVHVQ